jgi:hypothetical protein
VAIAVGSLTVNETPIWSHPLSWADIQREPHTLDLVADDQVLRGIARKLDVEALLSLSCRLTFSPWLDGVQIDGRIMSVATRLCGVTLDAFDETIDEPFTLRIVPKGSPNAAAVLGAVVFLDPEADDPPDVLEGDVIDPAAYVIEHLALALNPFPRRPGAVFEPSPDGAPPSPFAVLAQLKDPGRR